MFREHAATEVYVTGEFDDWGQTVKLEKKGESLFEKLVELPHVEDKVLYKVSVMIFDLVVIGVWMRSRSWYFSYPRGSQAFNIQRHVETWILCLPEKLSQLPLPSRSLSLNPLSFLSLPLSLRSLYHIKSH